MAYRRVRTLGTLETAAGPIPRVDGRWTLADAVGRVRVRLGLGRMSYAIAPGLYAAGTPDSDSPVLVTANYKLSFDLLRRALGSLSAWILVLDTRGINVWCAAGKGSFSTAEIVSRVAQTGLGRIVRHRHLIVPQLGAPAVGAQEVGRRTGFKVVFGPVSATDLPAFLAAGERATPAMRRVRFGLAARLEVAWLELATTVRVAVPLSVVLLAVTAWDLGGFAPHTAWRTAGPALLALWTGILSGTIGLAVLLPWLPGRMFSLRGAALGLPAALATLVAAGVAPGVQLASLALLSAGVAAYLALNYTGSTTFTSLSGVKREMRVAVPVLAGILIVAGVLPWVALAIEGVAA